MTEEQKKDNDIEIEELKKQLEEARIKCEEYLNGWKRERADFLNYKKEEMERIGNLAKYANEELILNLLPVLDNIDLAEIHLKDEGISQIKKQFLDLFKKEGIESIEILRPGSGQTIKFDANTMEAVEEVKNDGVEPGVVVEEVQKGYTIHDKLIRPAKVRISK